MNPGTRYEDVLGRGCYTQSWRNLSYARSGIDSKRSSVVIVIAAFRLR
jgi:hypothetical protein